MKHTDYDSRYLVLALLIILADRLSKWAALAYFEMPYRVTHFLDFELVFNRGVSWGFLHSDNPLLGYMVTGMVFCIIIALLLHTILKRLNQQGIYPEVTILAGACSNLVDRLVYPGVIDFIHLHYNEWSWPIFNIADMAIVLGICWIIYQQGKS